MAGRSRALRWLWGLACLALVAALSGCGARVLVGQTRINPKARIDPQRTYELNLWVAQIPLPWHDEDAHQRLLEGILTDLAQLNGNVRIELSWLPWDDDGSRVRDALAAGGGPDIYVFHHPGVYVHPSRQVPVDLYVPEETAADWTPAAWQAVSDSQAAWAWPAWVAPALWIGRSGVAEGAAEGLEGFVRHLEAAGSRAALALHDGALFHQLMVALTGRALLNESGEAAWGEQDLLEASEFLMKLRAAGLLTGGPGPMSRSRLSGFRDRSAQWIAPANPWFTRHLLGIEGSLGRDEQEPGEAPPPGDLRLFEPPGRAEWQKTTGMVRAVAVFRREPHAGDDHVRVAMQAAEALSRRIALEEGAYLAAVPAHPSSWETWRSMAGLSTEHALALIQGAGRLAAPPAAWSAAHRERRLLMEAAQPLIWEAMSMGADPADLAARLMEALQRGASG